MINILVYNNDTGRMERYARSLYDPMPYNNGTLMVGEFTINSHTDLLWTDKRTMNAWNKTRAAWGRPIRVGDAFKRIGEGGHSNQCQHYAGTAFDVAQNLTSPEHAQLRTAAVNIGAWTYVEPAISTPDWVHFDARSGTPACGDGFPIIREGSVGVYVATLQDALQTIGIPAVGIDGIFGSATRRAVMTFQRENNLSADGIAGCQTWADLTARANGFYRK